MTLKQMLTPRQFELAGLVSQGLEAKEIAGEMGISHHTVKRMTMDASQKVGVTGRVRLAVRYALEKERGFYAS